MPLDSATQLQQQHLKHMYQKQPQLSVFYPIIAFKFYYLVILPPVIM